MLRTSKMLSQHFRLKSLRFIHANTTEGNLASQDSRGDLYTVITRQKLFSPSCLDTAILDALSPSVAYCSPFRLGCATVSMYKSLQILQIQHLQLIGGRQRSSLRLHYFIIHTVPTTGDHGHQLLFVPLGASAQLHTNDSLNLRGNSLST